MLNAAGVTVYTQKQFYVAQAGPNWPFSGQYGIVYVNFTDGTNAQATIWIDATENGSLVGADYFRVGNGKNSVYPPTFNGNGKVQSITWNAVVRNYASTGIPGGLDPQSWGPPLGYQLPTLNPQPLLSSNGGIWPQAGWSTCTRNPTTPDWCFTMLDYRWTPDSKSGAPYPPTGGSETRTSLNWQPFNDYPTTETDYMPGSSTRRQTECNARLQAVQWLYYLRSALGIPWAIATDEGFNTGYNQANVNWCFANMSDWSTMSSAANYQQLMYNLPTQPYVREAARGIAPYTVIGADIYRQPGGGAPGGLAPVSINYFPTSIAIGEYNVDIHDAAPNASDLSSPPPNPWDSCSQGNTAYLEAVDVNGPFPGLPSGALLYDPSYGAPHCPLYPPYGQPGPGNAAGPFQVPYEAMFSNLYGNLIYAGKTISQTRVVNGATREHLEETATGQAAGMIAALSISWGAQPQYLNPYWIQWYLVMVGQPGHGGGPSGSAPPISAYQFTDVSTPNEISPFRRMKFPHPEFTYALLSVAPD
jgi:hypothetical protein